MRSLFIPALIGILLIAPFTSAADAHPTHAPCGTAAVPPVETAVARPASAALTARQVDYRVGDRETIQVWNFATQQSEPVACTYRAVNEHSYVLVADDVWSETNRAKINPSDVARISEVFERNSGPPPGLGTGIYEMLTERFAPVVPVHMNQAEPVRSDSMVFIAIVSIKSELEQGYVSGFVSGRDRANVVGSNFRNIVYIEGLKSPPAMREETLAHEFLHVIHVALDPYEERWIDEGIAVYAQTICGYPGGSGRAYFLNPAVGLFNDNSLPSFAEYDKAFLLMQYMADQFGEDLIGAILRRTDQGIRSIDRALESLGFAERFRSDVFPDWAVANLSPPRNDTPYAYATYNPLAHHPADFGNVGALPVGLSGSLVPWGVRYIQPTAGIEDGLQGTMTATASGVDWSITSVEDRGAEPLDTREWHPVSGSLYRDCTPDAPWIVVFPRGPVNGPAHQYSFDLHTPSVDVDARIASRVPEPDATGVQPQTARIGATFENVDTGWEVAVTASGQHAGLLDRDFEIVRGELDGACGITVTVTDLSAAPLPQNDLITVTVNGLLGPDGVSIPSSQVSWQFRTGAEDHTPPQVTVGLLPNPVLRDRVSIMLIADEDLYPDPAAPHSVHVVIDGATTVELDNVDGSRRLWSGTIALRRSGEYVLTVSAADAVGNSVTAAPLTYVVRESGDGSLTAKIVHAEVETP